MIKELNGAALAAYRDDGNAGFKKRWKKLQAAKKASGAFMAAAAPAGAAPTLPLVAVAEGDSWFDYKPSYVTLGRDLLGHLRSFDRVEIHRESEAGDTLENMVYGTAYDKDTFKPKPSQLDETLAAIDEYQPDIFLFSGGGNDVAGSELEAYLNHADSGHPTVRQEYIDLMFGEVFPHAFQYVIDKVKQRRPGIQIFLHGYDYAIPDGRGVRLSTNGWDFKGPWIRPALARKRVTPDAERRRIVADMIDRLNDMLGRVAAADPDVHHIDLRNTLRTGPKYQDDWANELHPTSDGFKLVARKFQAEIDRVFNLPPLP